MANSHVARGQDFPESDVKESVAARTSCETSGVKGHPRCNPEIESDKSLQISHIGDAQIVVAEEVSQAVSMMEEILNPSYSGVKALKQPSKHSHKDSELHVFGTHQPARKQEMKNGHEDSGNPKNGNLPLAEQSTNEEERSKVKVLPWVARYDYVEEAVQEYEIETTSTFLMGNPDRDFGKTFDETKHCHRIHLDGGGFGTALSPKLSLEGIPYIMMGNKRLVCHHGKPHNNSAKKIRGKRRLCTQASKKVGCPSHIVIRHVLLLPDFKFDKNKITEHRRRELSKLIKTMWKEKHVGTECRFYIEFPDVSSHKNHPLGEAAGVKQPIDKRVNERMLKLISDGMKSVTLIEESIKDFVKDELFRDSVCPPYSNRRFFPTQKDIANRIFKVSLSSHLSKLKKNELEELVNGVIEEQSTKDGFVFFRNTPGLDRGLKQDHHCEEDSELDCESNQRLGRENHHRMIPDSPEIGDPVPVSSKENLLFIYQNQHQRRLLARYGCDLTFLDPAHRAAAYAIPLYFLLVRTNCDYHIVAVMAMERESAEGLQEALGIIREANPSWSPQQFMVDASEEEIQTIESMFADCRVSITDVRRHQAWERWLGNPKHGTAKRRQELLDKMNGVATARTTEGYQAAMEALKGAWSQSSLKLMRAWFREKWMTNVQRWAYVYRQQRHMLPLLVNNGIGSQEEALTYPFIISNRHCALHSMLQILINRVLPNMCTRYIQTNKAWSSITNSTLPPLLHNRPQPFIDHYQERSVLAGHIGDRYIIQVTQSVFRVPGDPNHNVADTDSLVDLSVPSCTCDDFTATGYVCVHLLACIADGNDLLWEQLPSSYLFSPFLTVDEGWATAGAVGGAVGRLQSLSVDDSEDDECTTAVSGLSPEEEATSSLEAILAAVEAQTLTESTNPTITTTTATNSITDNPSLKDEAAHCQTVANELLGLTHTVTDREVLAHARTQMETIITTLRQALPRGELRDPVCCQQPADEVIQVHIVEAPVDRDCEICPPKRQRLEDEVHMVESRMAESEIEAAIAEDESAVEVYEDGRENLDGNESIITETIDLRQGAVFILEPSGMMRNFQITDASSTDDAIGSVIMKN